MNAYTMYEIGDIFKNSNGENYVILGLSEDRDKALLCTMKKPTFYIGAKGLCEHHWCHGHYFMEDIGEALEWFAKDDSEPEEKEDNRAKYLFKVELEITHLPGEFGDEYPTMYVYAYSFEEARDYIFNTYQNTDWGITDYNAESVEFYDATKKED